MDHVILEPPKRKSLRRLRQAPDSTTPNSGTTTAKAAAESEMVPVHTLQLNTDSTPRFRVQALARLMPVREDCVFWWATVAAVRIRTVFEAIKNIISEGVLVVDPDGIMLQEYDNTKVMVVFVRMRAEHLEQYGPYYCEKKLCIPLSIDEFFKGVKCINQSDVVGLCVTKASMNSSYPSLDLHIMHPTHGYCYQHESRMLHDEFLMLEDVNLQDNAAFYANFTIKSTFFKRYLNDCLPHGKNIKFVFRYDTVCSSFYVHLIPCDNVISMSRMRLRLECTNTEGLNQDEIEQISEKTAPKYSIANLLLFTKATPLSNTVEILLSHEFPLVVKYNIGDLGELRFCLAPVFSDQELDDYRDHTVTVHPGLSRQTDDQQQASPQPPRPTQTGAPVDPHRVQVAQTKHRDPRQLPKRNRYISEEERLLALKKKRPRVDHVDGSKEWDSEFLVVE